MLDLVFTKVKRAWMFLKTERQFRMRHRDAIVSDGVLIFGADRISAGRKLFLDRRSYLNTGTLNGRQGFIRMGDNVEIGPYAVLWGAGGITIGSNVHIGAHVSITAHEALQVSPERTNTDDDLEFYFAPVVIEDHVLICSGAQIIPGVRIGHHAMIGGGAIVTKDIPPYALAVGCPARVIRYSRKPENEPPKLSATIDGRTFERRRELHERRRSTRISTALAQSTSMSVHPPAESS